MFIPFRGSRFAALTLALLIPGAFFNVLLAQGGPPPAPPVTVAAPVTKRISTWDEYSGRFVAVASVEVRPRVSGFINHVHFKDGQIVKAGDPLFTIDPRPFLIAVESAQADIARTKAQVDLAENEVERARPLVKSGAVTERDFDQRRANLAVTRAQQLSAEASLKSAELNLEWTEVRAPISGRISDKKIDAGNLVTGGQQGATIMTSIVSLDPIHFEFDVSETDFLRYSRLFLSGDRPSSREVSNPVRIRLADEKVWTRQGRMNFVDNQLNPRSGTLRGRAIIDNKDQLLQPGLFARLQLFGGESDALLIPDAAVVSDQTRKIAFVVGTDNVVKAAPLELGPIYEGLRVVRGGLKPDDRVVIEGIANPAVRPGAKVTAQPGTIGVFDSN
ncbi:MAG: efflux transporter periplasmic adaptor subunit [Hyphomicrobium sp.]|nr:MAG: efflux transporter periplasmic adaptor subunit [Hyphomicrobium sp.]